MVQEGQYIPRDQWIHWDAETIAQLAAQEVQCIDTTSNCSESTIPYELDADMISQNNIEIVNTESINNGNDLDELPDINQLRAELTLLGGSDSPPPNIVMPTNYKPASPRYSPASPAYSPSQSPINIDSDSDHGYTPPQNDSPIVTGASEYLICQMRTLEMDRQVQLINMMGAYVNRNRIPIQINGVYIFLQANNIHDRKWKEYPNEACSDHCVIPRNTDKTFATFT